MKQKWIDLTHCYIGPYWADQFVVGRWLKYKASVTWFPFFNACAEVLYINYVEAKYARWICDLIFLVQMLGVLSEEVEEGYKYIPMAFIFYLFCCIGGRWSYGRQT